MSQADVYSEHLLPEWVPEPFARESQHILLVEWLSSPKIVDYTHLLVIEWAPQAKAQEQSLTLFVEWGPAELMSLRMLTTLVEWDIAPQVSLRTLSHLVEWLQGNSMWVEPGSIHVQGGGAPIMGVLTNAGTGIEVKELAYYQLADIQNFEGEEGLEPDPDDLNFEGGPLPPPGPNQPPIGPLPRPTIYGAEARYNAKDTPPTVGPDLVD